jgi:hypothetical protein
LDRWLHGSGNPHGWGFAANPDPTLLYVRGFDPATQEFQYQVNGRFGSTGGSSSGIIAPFQIGFQGHFTIGPDRTRDRLRTIFGGRRGGGSDGGSQGGGASALTPDFASRFGRVLPNPIPGMLALRDSIQMTTEQVSQLQAISDSLDAKNQAVSDSVQAMIAKAGDRPDPAVLLARLRPRLAQGRENIRAALERVQSVLTPEQWGRVPDRLKNPGRPGRRGGNRPD